MTRLIHWSEGMFMRVQTLQMLQQGFLERTDDLRRLGIHYPYGVLEAELARAALERGKVEFSRLRVVMRSGLEVIVPDHCNLEALEVRKELADSRSGEVTILLGVPEYSDTGPNAFRADQKADLEGKYRYVPRTEERADENTGDNRQPIVTRWLNARLLVEREGGRTGQEGLECLPVLRVKKGSTTGGADFRIERVLEYAPPLRLLSAGPEIRDLAGRAVGRLENARVRVSRKLRQQPVAADTVLGAQVRQLIRQLLLSRHAARLGALRDSPHVTPFEMFSGLNEALAELEALAATRDPEADPGLRYDHEALYPLFERLGDRIEAALREADDVDILSVEFKQAPDGVARAAVGPEFFAANVLAWYFAVETRVPRSDLALLLANRKLFELTAPKEVGTGVGGLQLREEADTPAGLRASLRYFRIDPPDRELTAGVWKRIQTAREMAINLRPHSNLAGSKFILYATLQRLPSDADAD